MVNRLKCILFPVINVGVMPFILAYFLNSGYENAAMSESPASIIVRSAAYIILTLSIAAIIGIKEKRIPDLAAGIIVSAVCAVIMYAAFKRYLVFCYELPAMMGVALVTAFCIRILSK